MEKNALSIGKQFDYPALDVLKFFLSILVVAIHVTPFSAEKGSLLSYINFGIQQYIARIAVPFFFASAAFLLFRKIDLTLFEKQDSIYIYISKNLRLYGTWMILLFHGGKVQFWYLGGLTIAILLISFLLAKGFSLRKLSILSVILYAIGLLGDSYYGLLTPLRTFALADYGIKLYDVLFSTTRNGLFMGVPFVVIGCVLSTGKIKLKPKLSIIGFFLSEILLGIEVFLLKTANLPRDYNMFFFLLPATFFLLSFASGVNIPRKPIYKRLRIASIIVYFSHLFICSFITYGLKALDHLFGCKLAGHSFLIFSLTVVISVSVGIIVAILSEKEKFRFLKYLYS